MISLKLEHVKKQDFHYWGPGDGNDCPGVLPILYISTSATADDHPFFFARVCLEMIEKGIQVHISKEIFQYVILEKQDFEWTITNEDHKWYGLVMLWLILKKINTTIQVGISNLKDVIEQATLQKISNNVTGMPDRMQHILE